MRLFYRGPGLLCEEIDQFDYTESAQRWEKKNLEMKKKMQAKGYLIIWNNPGFYPSLAFSTDPLPLSPFHPHNKKRWKKNR